MAQFGTRFFNTAAEAFTRFGERIKDIITNVAERLGKVVSGQTVESIETTTEFKGTNAIEFNVYGSKTFDYIEEGRPPGAPMPPEGALLSWMGLVGFQGSEFVLRRSISEKGIEPTPLLETSFVEIARDFDKFPVGEAVLNGLSIELSRMIDEGFKFPTVRVA
jgi:hypothetical protein